MNLTVLEPAGNGSRAGTVLARLQGVASGGVVSVGFPEGCYVAKVESKRFLTTVGVYAVPPRRG